jgi:hypothetical protein
MTNERLALTITVLIGFFITVLIFMFADMDGEKKEVMKLVMTAQGTACTMCLGFWFRS